MRAYEQVTVNAPAEKVLDAVRDALRSRGLTEYAVVDHGHDMAAVGAGQFKAWTLVFGNPAAGAKLLARDLAAAVDIPLRLAVIATDDQQSRIILRDTRSLLGDELTEVADSFTYVLRAIAAQARDLASAQRPGAQSPKSS